MHEEFERLFLLFPLDARGAGADVLRKSVYRHDESQDPNLLSNGVRLDWRNRLRLGFWSVFKLPERISEPTEVPPAAVCVCVCAQLSAADLSDPHDLRQTDIYRGLLRDRSGSAIVFPRIVKRIVLNKKHVYAPLKENSL